MCESTRAPPAPLFVPWGRFPLAHAANARHLNPCVLPLQNLGKEVETERRRAVRAEADRDALRSQIQQLKGMLARSEGEFASIASAVEHICHDSI